MAYADNNSSIPGKRLLPRLAVGCLVFAAIMGFGTFLLGQMMTPYLKKKNDQYMHERQLQQQQGKTPPPAGP